MVLQLNKSLYKSIHSYFFPWRKICKSYFEKLIGCVFYTSCLWASCCWKVGGRDGITFTVPAVPSLCPCWHFLVSSRWVLQVFDTVAGTLGFVVSGGWLISDTKHVHRECALWREPPRNPQCLDSKAPHLHRAVPVVCPSSSPPHTGSWKGFSNTDSFFLKRYLY